jgi:isoquinoline 1-oxidoreductase subunit beta
MVSLHINGQTHELDVPDADNALFAPDAFVRVARDCKVTIIRPQVEMGQGTYTSMSMLIAKNSR